MDWEALKREYGTQTSPVVLTRARGAALEDERTEMSIASAIELIQSLPGSEDGLQSVYIKDWHMVKQLTEPQTEPYKVPAVFADDWMNNLPHCAEVDDFRFVYAGTAGTQTLLHRDVYTSYSWSTNVVGRKRWWLFPPHTIPALRRFPRVETSELVPDIATLLSLTTSPATSARKEYPELEHAWQSVQIIDQAAGETVFVPSNWHHQVLNLTDCVSINRNWCNAVNLPSLYGAIVAELAHVEESLCDVRDMLASAPPTATHGAGNDAWKREFYALVQDVAVQDAGWAWAGFWNMVLRNLEHPATSEELRPPDEWVQQRLLPLVEDFETREDAEWLDPKIGQTAQRCKVLLQNMWDGLKGNGTDT